MKCVFLIICRPVDTPQSYSKGPQPPQAASPQTYRVPVRYVQQNPYGAMQVKMCANCQHNQSFVSFMNVQLNCVCFWFV